MKDVKVVVPNQYSYVITTSMNTPLVSTGIDNLVQMIVKSMKTTPGRDIFSFDYGMGLKYLLPNSGASIEEQRAKSQVGKGLMKIEEELLRNQASLSLDPEQKLQTLKLVNVVFDTEQGLWDITVQVTSVSGTSVVVGMTL